MPEDSYKFGLLPGKIPVGLKDLTYYRAGSLPKAPASAPVPDIHAWGMNGNDTHGDCGVAGYNHGCMTVDFIKHDTSYTPVTDDQVVQYYMNYTGNQDTGVVLADFLAYVKQNGFYGHTLTAYAPVNVGDVQTLHFAVNAYGFAYTGISVTQSMMDAFQSGEPWTLDDAYSEVVGGHCIPVVGYDSDYLYCVTWGDVQPVSYSLWSYISSEAWALIPGEFAVDDGRGINLAALQADLALLNV